MSTKIAAFFATAVLFVVAAAHAGEGHQSTTFRLRAGSAIVTHWIETHPDDLEIAAGGEVLATKDDMAKVRTDSPEAGELVFIIRRKGENGRYVEKMIKRISGPIAAHSTEVSIATGPIGGSEVTIRMSASVNGLQPIKISVGLRRAIRGMRAELERRFGAVE
jgi:hypothetical protein